MTSSELKLELCEKRKAILAQDGHLLVCGGPGSGKTTIALLKAKRLVPDLAPGQEILFLSFSRAAVRQILTRCRSVLTAAERRVIKVQTYHSFCLDLLATFGRILTGRDVQVLFPGPERVKKADYAGDWAEERRRQAKDGTYCFDLFAGGVASILEGNSAVRTLVGDKYPMVIVDEFQDTDDDQWRLVRSLSGVTDVFCLADPEQRIFDYRDDVDPKRLEALRTAVSPAEFDLGGENHRSKAAVGILATADAVLHNTPLPKTSDVRILRYAPKSGLFQGTTHAAVIFTFISLRKMGVDDPCVAVLGRSNPFVAKLSTLLGSENIYSGRTLKPIDHDVVWDAELSAAAASVVGSILEWPGLPAEIALPQTLTAIADYYRLKNADKPSDATADKARKFRDAAAAMAGSALPKTKAAKDLVGWFGRGVTYTGDPVRDWKIAREPLECPALADIAKDVRLIRLFRASDALGQGLSERWLTTGAYLGAAILVKRILDRERLLSADRDPEGCVLMTMHKSKGKEFDGVVMVEGPFEAPFFNLREGAPFAQSRRLLRVGITRARRLVTLVRPMACQPLVD